MGLTTVMSYRAHPRLYHKRHPSLPNVLRLLALVDHHPVQLPN
jgi:hypothetical protein